MKYYHYLFILIFLVGIGGCAGIEPPRPDKILTHPLGTGPIRIGMIKEEVREIWGEPDTINVLGESKDVGPTIKEEWVYRARISNFPFNYGYLSKPMRLVFDGKNLIKFTEE